MSPSRSSSRSTRQRNCRVSQVIAPRSLTFALTRRGIAIALLRRSIMIVPIDAVLVGRLIRAGQRHDRGEPVFDALRVDALDASAADRSARAVNANARHEIRVIGKETLAAV